MADFGVILGANKKVLFGGCPAYVATSSSAASLKNNKVKIVTFNYDQSLENYLTNAITYSYPELSANPKQDPTALIYKEAIEPNVFHMYGMVGEFIEDGQIASPYGKDPEDFSRAADSIKLIHEKLNDIQRFELPRKWIDEADTIAFLGFGFNSENCKNLGFPRCLPQAAIYSTNIGMTHLEFQKAAQRVLVGNPNIINGAMLTKHQHFDQIESDLEIKQPTSYDCLSLLRNFPILT